MKDRHPSYLSYYDFFQAKRVKTKMDLMQKKMFGFHVINRCSLHSVDLTIQIILKHLSQVEFARILLFTVIFLY